jgi:hypothetical protein
LAKLCINAKIVPKLFFACCSLSFVHVSQFCITSAVKHHHNLRLIICICVQDSFENIPTAGSVNAWHHGIFQLITGAPELPHTGDLQVLQTYPGARGRHSDTAETLWQA